jgi:hypothetical protein
MTPMHVAVKSQAIKGLIYENSEGKNKRTCFLIPVIAKRRKII